MQPCICLLRSLFRRLPQPFAVLLGAASFLALTCVAAAQSGTGVITGTVSNTATGNLLPGARVEIPQLGVTTLTDLTGRYVLSGVPAGTHEVMASYTGLDPARRTVSVAAGQRATAGFDLTSDIYMLEAFEVTGEIEGHAAAITTQRNAENLRNIVSMDSFGNLPNMSAGELAVRLPGVAGNLDDEGNVTGVTIRGMGPTLNRITVDGGLISNVGGLNRQFQMHSLTGAMFDQLEVIKGHTPDKGADSLGGTVNLRTRSPLSMREKRRISYSFAARWAPPFVQHIPLRQDHRVHPLTNLSYQEVFGVLGGERNLGVAVNVFYSENVTGYFRTIRDFQNTLEQPAFVWDYRTQDAYNNRKQGSVNAKFDFRYSPTTKFTFNTIYNDAHEPFDRRYETRAFTNQTAPNATTSGVVPGFTHRVTEVRPVAASVIDVTHTMFSFFNRTRQFDFGAEHELNPLHIDYNVAYSRTHNNLGSGKGGTLTNRISGVGWILDRTESDLYPRFIQTAGPDITNPANYRPQGQLNTRNNDRDVEIKEVRANFRYDLPTRFPLFFKTGAQWREQMVREVSRARRWIYTGTTALPADPSIVTWDSIQTGRQIPQWEAASFIHAEVPRDPSLWREDEYFREMSRFTGTRGVTETVTAGYLMGQGKIERLGFLGGVRVERTEDDSWGWVRARVPSTPAQQQADPVGAAARDYADNRREISGRYTKAFPSAHLTYDINENLKARLSWSTSFGRPAMTNLLPNETVNEANETLRINNPSLLPQTAKNWDAALDYYFEPAGNFSVGWFHKTISDYIVNNVEIGTVPTGTDEFGGQYGGFTLLSATNAGEATVQGWEFSYQQQFTFLPGLLRGLAMSANYTTIRTHGDFGGSIVRATGEVAGFIPKTANASLSWRHRGFSTRVLVNYTGEYLQAFAAASAARNQWRYSRTIVNVGAEYQFRPSFAVFADVNNLFNEPISMYRGIPDQMERTLIHGTTINIGIKGRF